MRGILIRAATAGAIAALLLAPAALADTCCANTSVTLDPASADPGDAVTVRDLRCLESDNSPSATLDPRRFWLWPGTRSAEDQPDTTPAEGLPADLPPVEQWHAFDELTPDGAGAATAILTVPDVDDGSYQLWWWCAGGGPGAGIHYSTGSRLAVGMPDTATDPATHESKVPGLWPGLLAGFGAATFGLALRRRTRSPAGR